MAVRQIGIRISVDAQSGMAELPRLGREFDNVGNAAEQASVRATRSLGAINTSMRDLVGAGVAVSLVTKAVHELTNAITALPSGAFDFTKNLEVSQVGMAGILSSMTAINGKQLEYNQAVAISSGMIAKLNDDALRTAATSQELVTVFQALLAPGLAARMSLDEIRQLTVVGANAVKSIGLGSHQVVQELRDLVAGGITPASSTLATALGLKDSDIAKAKASSEGLFAFLMERMKGFQASSEAYSATIKGRLDQIKEGSIRVAADGFDPMIQAAKQALGEVSALFVTFKADGSAQLNTGMVNSLKDISDNAVQAAAATRDVVASVWEHRDAVVALAAGYAAIKTGQWASAAMSVVTANIEVVNASRLAAVQAAAQGTANVEVAATSRMKIAALLAELEVQQAAAQAGVAATAAETAAAQAKVAHLAVTQEVIIASRAEVVAKMEATRTTIAQAEAQIVAARAAGAQSFALALVREGTVALSVAQAQQAVLMSELALLGRQQASVQAALVASTAAQALATEAQAVATNAAAVAAGRLTAANGAATLASGAASLASRGFGVAVGALGGPVGVGIAAVAAMGIWLYKLKGNADDAAEAVKAVGRAEMGLATGRAVRDKDVRNINAQLEAARDKRDEIEGRAGNVAKNATAQARQAASLAAANAEIAKYEGLLKNVADANNKGTASTAGLTLTLTGAEQAWKKANDGIKTSSAAQQEYETKLSASRLAWETYKSSLQASGADPQTIAARQAEQNQVEAALAAERDKHIKQLGAGAATAQSHAMAAQIEAVKQGYKAIAAQTADGLDEIDSLRKQDMIGEYTAVQRRTALQLQDMDAQKQALQAELALAQKKKDSGTEQARLTGQLTELEQKRVALQNRSARDLQELLVKPQLEHVAANYKTADSVKELAEKQEAANEVFGKSKTAIELMTLATMKQQLQEAEGSDRFTPQYIASLQAKITAQERYAQSLQGAEYKDLMRKEQDWLDQAKERASLYEDEQQLAGLTNLERAKIVATRQIELRLAKELAEIDKGNLSDTQKDELRIKAREAAQIDSSAAVNKVVQEDWQKTTDQINQSLTDAIMKGGKSGSDYLKDLFRTMVLRPVISAVMSPVAGAVNGVINGAMNSIGMGTTGSGGGDLNLSAISSLFGGGGGMGVAGTVANGFASAANSLANLGFDTLSNVALDTANTVLQFKDAINMGGDILGYATAAYSLSQGKYATAAGQAIGTYFGGPIGSFIGSKIGGWIDNYFAGETRSGATYDTGADGKARYQQGPSGGEIAGDSARAMFDSAQASINATLKAVGSTATLTGYTAGLESSKNGKGFNFSGGYIDGKAFGENLGRDGGQFAMKSQDSQEAFAAYGVQLSQSIIEALQVSDIPKAITDIINTGLNGSAASSLSSEAATKLLATINTVIVGVTGFNAAVLTLPFENLKNLGFDAAAGLIAAAGGMDKLGSGLTGYYDNFYTAEEKRLQTIKNINAATAGSGLDAATATRASYRALIDAQDVTTESGRAMYLSLLGASSAFAGLSDAAGNFVEKMKGAAAEFSTLQDYQFASDMANTTIGKAMGRQLGIPGFAGGGDFAGGLRIVGEHEPELEATGPSRIYNSSQMRQILSGKSGGDTARLEALVEKLTQEVEALRQANTAENTAIAGATHKTARHLSNFEDRGMPVTTFSDLPLATVVA